MALAGSSVGCVKADRTSAIDAGAEPGPADGLTGRHGQT